MQLSRKALNARWAWTSAAAFAALMVLSLADTVLGAKSGYGAVDLQNVPTAWGIRSIMDRWISPPDLALAGFGLGFDYGAALFFGASRRASVFMPLAPVSALCSACERSDDHSGADGRGSAARERLWRRWWGCAGEVVVTPRLTPPFASVYCAAP
jgi:hypothetical protein